MAKIKNKMNQPLPINLDNGESIHLLPKGVKTVTEEQMKSKELKIQMNKGNIIVLSVE